MNQGKLEVVKQEMARMNVAVFIGVDGRPIPEIAAAFIRAEWVACALLTAGKAEASV